MSVPPLPSSPLPGTPLPGASRIPRRLPLPGTPRPAGGWPLVVAHRGVHATGLQENTLPAIRAAIAAGVDMVELDVRRTRDGVLVVHHDARIRNSVLGPRIRDHTFAELQAMLPPKHRLTRLDEAVAAVRGRVPLDVELKEAGYEAQALGELRRGLRDHEFVIKSFKPQAIRAVELLAPRVQTGLLVYELPVLRAIRRELDPARPVRMARRHGADFVGIQHGLATGALFDAAEAGRMPVLVWTVNRPERVRELLHERRAAAVVTDLPNHALAWRTRMLAQERALGRPARAYLPLLRT